VSKIRKDLEWQDMAECARRYEDGSSVYDPELFFPVGTTGPSLLQIAEAKTVCAVCPVRPECIEWVVNVPFHFSGVAGGMSEKEITRLRSGRKRV
jgi:WhiB family redox-sensing transcriptional regulator